MALQKPYVKRIAVSGETIPASDHNKAENQLEALTLFGNRTWATAGRPTPSASDLYPMGFNTTLLAYEFWNGTSWIQIGASKWEPIQTVKLGSSNAVIALTSLSCGLASGSAKYQGLYIWAFLKATGGSISNPRLEANSDPADANYYGAGGANDPRFFNGSLLVGTNSYLFEGILMRSNGFATEPNAYLWNYFNVIDVDGGAFANAARSDDGWKWLNVSPDDVLNTLDFKAPANQFLTGSQVRIFGIRDGI